jgi:hypothetical protein
MSNQSGPHRFRDEGGLDWAGGVREEGGSGERSDDKARWYDAVRTLPDRLWYDAVRTPPDRQWQQRPNIEEVDIATSVGDALWSCEGGRSNVVEHGRTTPLTLLSIDLRKFLDLVHIQIYANIGPNPRIRTHPIIGTSTVVIV